MTIWFTSDTHFNHAKVIEYDNRPFLGLEEMTEGLIDAWSIISPGDTVYHLGDFALSYGAKHREPIDSILKRLPGVKHLVIGNHDRKEVVNNKRWATVSHYKEIKIDLGGVHKQRIVMCHYAMRTWNQMHRRAWMLHGHSHGNLVDCGGRIMDVGVDANGYKPVSLGEVCEYMSTRSHVVVDHHS